MHCVQGNWREKSSDQYNTASRTPLLTPQCPVLSLVCAVNGSRSSLCLVRALLAQARCLNPPNQLLTLELRGVLETANPLPLLAIVDPLLGCSASHNGMSREGLVDDG